MNYGEEGQFALQVRVTIEPLWYTPTQSVVEQMGRSQTETRMMALGDQLATFIRQALESKQTPEEWATVSQRLYEHFRVVR